MSQASGGGISYNSTNGEISVDSTVVRTSGAQTVGGAKTLTSNLTVGTTTDSTYILFPDKNVLDNPTAVGDKESLLLWAIVEMVVCGKLLGVGADACFRR